MELVQVIYDNRKVKSKDGKKEFTQKMFYLVAENGKKVAIKPVFEEGYTYLDAYSRVEHDLSPKPVKEDKKDKK